MEGVVPSTRRQSRQAVFSIYARQLAVKVTDYALHGSGVNTTYAMLHQLQSDIAAKQKSDADKRGASVKF